MTYRYISNFYRTKGATDEKERKKRGVGGYLAGGVGVGLAGQLASRNLDNRAVEAYKTGMSASGKATELQKVANTKLSQAQKSANIAQASMSPQGDKSLTQPALDRANRLKDESKSALRKVSKYEDIGKKAYKSGDKLGRYGKVAKIAGLVGAAGLASVAGYNYGKNRQDERQSLGGQAKMLKNKIKERLNKR